MKHVSWILMILMASNLHALPDTLNLNNQGDFLSLSRKPLSENSLSTNVSVITENEIKRSHAQNLSEILEYATSVDVIHKGTLGSFSQVRLRGTPSPNQTQILIDGLPIGGIGIQSVDISQIPMDNVKRIEIIRGGSSVQYGANAMAGIIHIITKRATAQLPLTSITLEGRSFDTQIYRAQFSAKGKWSEGFLSVSRNRSDGFQQNQDSDNFSASAQLGITLPAHRGKLLVDGALTKSELGDPMGTPIPFSEWDGEIEKTAVDQNARVNNEVMRGRVSYTGFLTERIEIDGSAYIQKRDFDTTPLPITAPDLIAEELIVGGDIQGKFPFGFLLGVAVERDKKETNNIPRHHLRSWSIFLQETIELRKLSLISGVRLDQHSQFGNIYNPRLTAVYHAGNAIKLSANASRSYKAPTFSEYFCPSSRCLEENPLLHPEIAWSYDFGSELSFPKSIRMKATGFFSRIRERIIQTTTSFANQGRAEISGLEIEGKWQTKNHIWSGNFNYTYLRASGQKNAENPWLPLQMTPKHTANASLTFQIPFGFSLMNRLRYVHKQFGKDGERGLEIPSYTIWNIKFAQQVLEAEIFVLIKNMTDKHYSDSLGDNVHIPQPGRTFWGGITIRFSN